MGKRVSARQGARYVIWALGPGRRSFDEASVCHKDMIAKELGDGSSQALVDPGGWIRSVRTRMASIPRQGNDTLVWVAEWKESREARCYGGPFPTESIHGLSPHLFIG